jgi:hypothetical protein
MSLRWSLIIAAAGIAIATPALAGGVCENGSLNGSYAFQVQGQNLGIFDSSGVLHPYNQPEAFGAVGEYMFDGNGGFTRIDYNTVLGAVGFPSTALNDQGFRTGISGTYSVSEDCTASFTVGLTTGTQVILAGALVDYGETVLIVIKSEHVASVPAASNTSDLTCDSGCDLAVQLVGQINRNSVRRR